MLIEELPAAAPGRKRELRPLSVQECLELLVRVPRSYRVACNNGTLRSPTAMWIID